MTCSDCGAELERTEIGLSRKLINRATKEFFCLRCLSLRFHADPQALLDLAERFRESGCTLFT